MCISSSLITNTYQIKYISISYWFIYRSHFFSPLSNPFTISTNQNTTLLYYYFKSTFISFHSSSNFCSPGIWRAPRFADLCHFNLHYLLSLHYWCIWWWVGSIKIIICGNWNYYQKKKYTLKYYLKILPHHMIYFSLYWDLIIFFFQIQQPSKHQEKKTGVPMILDFWLRFNEIKFLVQFFPLNLLNAC